MPAASAYPVGQVLWLCDESGACSSTNTVTVNYATMDGTAVSADELWSLPDVEPLLKNIPNGGAFDRRYIEAEADAEKLLVPTVVSAGGFAVPSADW